MTEKERALAWMDSVVAWKETEPEEFSRSVWIVNNNEKKVLVAGVVDLAKITGTPFVTWRRDDYTYHNAYVEMYYKGWIFYDFIKREW